MYALPKTLHALMRIALVLGLCAAPRCTVHPNRPPALEDDVLEPDVPEECTADGVCDPSCAGDPDCGGSCTCELDGCCVSACDHDPDCGGECVCDATDGACEAVTMCSSSTCTCDPDCKIGLGACGGDDHCDAWCPHGMDPDCTGDPRDGVHCCGEDGWCNAAACHADVDCPSTCNCSSDGCCDPMCDDDPDCPKPCACGLDSCCDLQCPDDPDCQPNCTCEPDGCCSSGCANDPDCIPPCECDRTDGICDTIEPCNGLRCNCDPHCTGSTFACSADQWCDPYCAADMDIDCQGHPDNGYYCR